MTLTSYSRAIFVLQRLIPLVTVTWTTVFASQPATPGLSQLRLPYVIAHRGGSLLWPEHTMLAYERSVDAGNQFIEADCQILKNGSVIVLHDGTLERTTTGKGTLEALTAREWAGVRVDGEKLLGPPWRLYEVPKLDEVLVRFGNRKILFLEAKNGPAAGAAIAARLREYKIQKDYVVVNSFDPAALRESRAAGYKTCLNLADEKLSVDQIVKMKHWGVACHTSVSEAYVRALKQAGLMVLIYTPSTHAERAAALAKGADGFYCDDPIYMSFDTSYRCDTDPYSRQTWYAGMLESQPGGRGRFTAPDKWGIDASYENRFFGCLQGWLSPERDGVLAPEWSVELSVTFGVGLMDGRWASLGVFTDDRPLVLDTPTRDHRGFNFLFYNNGAISIYKYDATLGVEPKLLGITPAGKVQAGVTRRYRVTVTATHLKTECLDNGTAITVEDASNRGSYITLGVKGQKADFSKISMRILK